MALPARKRYCVFGCTELGAYMHSFPHPERHSELFETWMSIVGGKIKDMDPWRIYKNKRVCDYHFTHTQKVASHRLIHNAVPTINLSGVFLSPALSVQLEHNYCQPGAHEIHLSSTCAETVLTVPTTEFVPRLPYSEATTSKATVPEGHKSAEYCIKKYKSVKKELRNKTRQCRKLKKKELNYKARLAKAQEMLNGPDALNRITKNMTLSGKIFTKMQYRQALKNPKGRRYNTEEKILALSIYKKSPKCYSLLSKYFKLPCAKSLKNLLRDIKITPGINKVIFNKIKETVSGLSEKDRLCTLIFDEMSITPHVQYDSKNDTFKGFISTTTDLKLANHVLVFMIKGIKMNFKQPVAYYFTQSLKTQEMKELIKEVVRHVNNCGLKILCTVCDQGSTNVSAINSLVADTKENYLKKGLEWRLDLFEIDGKKIIPIYDVPHLMKGLRNNLLTKDLRYKDSDGTDKTIKWKYFEMLYEADKSRGELRYLHKLTEEHIKIDKIKKMRVKMAVQVFSHSVAVTTDHLTARNILPEECRQLIPFVLFIDKLFDSLNAGTFHIPNGKIYRGAVKKNSPHHELWRNAITFLKNVKFISQKKDGNKIRLIESSVPSVKNLIKTIEGMQAIWKIVNQKYSLDLMLTRNFNQDPIENFFGNIRSIGVRNVSPNCHTFEGAFKTVLLNNYSCKQAVNTNCEEDFNACLQTLEFFLKEKENITKKLIENENIEISEGLYEALSNVSTSTTYSGNYVCGWVLTKCMTKIIKKCKNCRGTLVSRGDNESNKYIRSKEYDKTKRWLCYPSDVLANCFSEIQNITTTVLKTALKRKNIKENIKMLSSMFVTYPFYCENHKESLKDFFTDTCVNIIICSWCRSINRILAGKITNEDLDDPMKLTAQKYFNTHQHHKKNK